MKVNIIANHMRTQRGEPLILEMLNAELTEVLLLKAKTPEQKRSKNAYVKSLRAAIQYKQNRLS